MTMCIRDPVSRTRLNLQVSMAECLGSASHGIAQVRQSHQSPAEGPESLGSGWSSDSPWTVFLPREGGQAW